jgi:hypothetical protein
MTALVNTCKLPTACYSSSTSVLRHSAAFLNGVDSGKPTYLLRVFPAVLAALLTTGWAWPSGSPTETDAHWLVNTKKVEAFKRIHAPASYHGSITPVIPEQLPTWRLHQEPRPPNRTAERMNDDRVNWRIFLHPSSGDPDERSHPVVNSAPQQRGSPMGEPIHVNVDE